MKCFILTLTMIVVALSMSIQATAVKAQNCSGFFSQQSFQQQVLVPQFQQQAFVPQFQQQFFVNQRGQFQFIQQPQFQFQFQNGFVSQNFVFRPQRRGVSRILFGR